MKATTRITMTLAAIVTAGTMLAAPVFAQDTQWQKDHPRREQVNDRLAKQNKRITKERKEGEITKAQAQSLRANDKTIRAEEKGMASQNGSHITKADQKALNQQLNQNSQAIGK